MRPLFGKTPRLGFADTMGRAGDNGNFVFESHGASAASVVSEELGFVFERASGYAKAGVLPSRRAPRWLAGKRSPTKKVPNSPYTALASSKRIS